MRVVLLSHNEDFSSRQAASQLVFEQFQKRLVKYFGKRHYLKKKKNENEQTWAASPSALEKEENMKTVEGLLEKGLIEVANKEEELKASALTF